MTAKRFLSRVLFLVPLALVLGCALSQPPYDRLVIDTFVPTSFYGNDTYLTLIDAAGTVIAEDDNGNPLQLTYPGCSRINFQGGLTSGTYYIKVHKPTDGDSLYYCIRAMDYDPGSTFPGVASVVEASDTDDAVDGNGVPVNPVSITLGQVISRTIYPEPVPPYPDPAADVDWFELVLP